VRRPTTGSFDGAVKPRYLTAGERVSRLLKQRSLSAPWLEHPGLSPLIGGKPDQITG